MRIAFVYDQIYPYRIGGAEKRYWELAKKLAKKHEVHLFGMKLWEGESVIERENVILHGVCAPKSVYTGGGRRSVGQALYYSACLFPALMREERFDVIDCANFPYFHCFPTSFLSSLRRSKFVVTWHEVWGDYWYQYMGRLGIFGKNVEKLVARMGQKAISVSELTKRKLVAEGVAESKISVIPNGVDFEVIRKAKPKRIKNDVLFVGRLIRDKNVDVLIGAISLLPEVRCTILGEGPERERLELLVKKKNIEKRVKFLDFLPTDSEVYSRIKSSKLLVIPSTREGFGLVAVEANACGIPVLTVDSPDNAVREFVKDGVNGKVVKLNDRSIADGIKQLFGMKVKIKLEGYEWSDIAKRVEEVYRA